MATAILDIELTNMPDEINGLYGYSHAFMLIRYKGTPIGKLTVPLIHGRLKMQQLSSTIYRSVSNQFWKAFTNDFLDYDETVISSFVAPKASIAICTRNRTDDLRRCLDAIMLLPNNGQEVLVIDNCPSNNDTKDLVATYPSVRYIVESRPGLDVARNRALKEASNEIVAFTDDDAVPDRNWLKALIKNFNNPLVMCVAGITMPLELETDAQEAFERYSPFSKGFNRVVYSRETHHPLSAGRIGAGANMALRKTVLKTVGKFDEALDAGTVTESGGDHEYFVRILLAGYQIVYEPDALNWHRHRRTHQETYKAIRGYGIGVYAFWTRLFFVEKQFEIIKFPYQWFIHNQLPNTIKSLLKRPGSQPLNLRIGELYGCLLGPWKYLIARRRLNRKRLQHEAA